MADENGNGNGLEKEEKIEQEIEQKEEERRKKDQIGNEKGVSGAEIVEEMEQSFIDYAMSVIVDRALPAVEDGLKPVHRKILYAMHAVGLDSSKATKKTAAIVGEVLGKYHLDGDSAAAMRYTEAKLSKISEELLADIEKETVKMLPNYDNSTEEPQTLPGLLPNLLINGATGIAVGMATNMPPHNLTEVCDAIVQCINKPAVSVDELSEIVTGPDFPTGGTVSGEGIKEMYKTGKGKLIIRGRVSQEEHKGRTHIIITEIPYMVNKADLVTSIAKLATEKKLPDVSDLRDESSKGKVRIVIELKKDASPKFTINKLYTLTRLQDSFDANMLALIEGKPKVLNLKEIVEAYVNYRKKVVIARSKFDLKKAEDRLEIVVGLLIALKKIDEIVEFIKKSENAQAAHDGLMKKFDLTTRQAKAVLETRLQQLTRLEDGKLKEEEKELKGTISYLKKLLGDIEEILSVIKK